MLCVVKPCHEPRNLSEPTMSFPIAPKREFGGLVLPRALRASLIQLPPLLQRPVQSLTASASNVALLVVDVLAIMHT